MFGAGQVEGEQAGENLFVGHVGGPAIGGGDGSVELFVGEVEPGGAGVVEVGEGALFEFALGQARGIEPRCALAV